MNEAPKPISSGIMSLAQQLSRRWAGYMLIIAALILFSLEVLSVIKRSMLLMPPPVRYATVIPDKEEYEAGDVIHFQCRRTSRLTDGKPILLLTIDSFENQETGEVYAGLIASRVVRESGVRSFRASRRIPLDTTPGIYVFEGWASSQTNPLSAPAEYSSTPFRVVPKKLPSIN